MKVVKSGRYWKVIDAKGRLLLLTANEYDALVVKVMLEAKETTGPKVAHKFPRKT